MTERLVLGTAQFGLDYGINNINGRLTKKEIFHILKIAHSGGIRELDTANVYGNSEKLIGEFLDQNRNLKFKITSKISKKSLSFESQINNSLSDLRIKKIDTLLFHSLDLYEYFKDQLQEYISFNKNCPFDEIGVSVYTNKELQTLMNEKVIDRIQVPFNLFDNVNYRGDIFLRLKSENKKIDIRSIFLQGLFFIDTEKLPEKLKSFKTSLELLKEISNKSGLNIQQLAMGYVSSFSFIDKILIGVDSIDQINNNLKYSNTTLSKSLKKKLENIPIENPEFLNPVLWGE